MLRRVLAGFVLMLGATPLAAQDQVQIGPWRGKARVNEANKTFTRCTVEAPTQDGLALMFGMSSGKVLELWLGRSDWTLTPRSSHPITLTVDNNPGRAGMITAVSDKLARAELLPRDYWLSALRSGKVLQVEATSSRMALPLEGSGAALQWLERCVEERLAGAPRPPKDGGKSDPPAASNNPFAGSGAQTPPAVSAEEAELRREAARLKSLNERTQDLTAKLFANAKAALDMHVDVQAVLDDKLHPEDAKTKFSRVSDEFKRLEKRSQLLEAELVAFKPTRAQPRSSKEAMLNSLRTITDFADRAVNETVAALSAAANGDKEAGIELARRASHRGIVTLEIENLSLEIARDAVEGGHPQRSIFESAIHINEFVVFLLRSTADFSAGRPVEIAAFRAEGARLLAEIELAIGAGERNLQELQKRAAEMRTQKNAEVLAKAMDTYPASFRVEREALSICRNALKDVERALDAGDRARAPEIESFLRSLEIPRQARAAHHAERVRLIGQVMQ